MRTSIMFGMAAAIAAATVAPAVASATDDTGSRTLAEVLLADAPKDGTEGFDRRWGDYDIVTQAVLLFPDLVAAASDPDATLTVFLPNDQAFRKLVRDVTGEWVRNESEVFGAVAALGLDTVRAVLTYHIVGGAAISYGAALQADGAALATLQGGTITVEVAGWRWKYVRLADADPDDRDPVVVNPDIGGELANGYAHGISRVLRPINLP